MALNLSIFGEHAQLSHYSGRWVPIVELSSKVLTWPALVRGADKDALHAANGLPIHLDDGGPEVLTDGSGQLVSSELNPTETVGDALYRVFVLKGRGGPTLRWYEPIQPFLLYWDAWRTTEGSTQSWLRVHGDNEPEEIGRWRVTGEGESEVEVLEVRMDRLLPFLAAFKYDLVLHTIVDVHDSEPLPGEEKADLQENFSVKAKTYASISGERVQARAHVTVIFDAPPYDESDQPWELDLTPPPQPYRILDRSGKERMAIFPDDEFLTNVFFKQAVLERYHQDAEKYEVRPGLVLSRFTGWTLQIAVTAAGNLHAYLGDLGYLPLAVQQHWQSHAVVDESGIPEDRKKRDFEAKWEPAPLDDISKLRAAIEVVDAAAQHAYGTALYAPPSAMQAGRIKSLRVPSNNTIGAFQDQLGPLALLMVDHIDSKLLDAAQVPSSGGDGTLNRLARLVGRLSGKSDAQAKEVLGGLYAIQSLRSTLGAHRADAKAKEALKKAKIDMAELSDGFIRLLHGATGVLQSLAELFSKQPAHASSLTGATGS